MKPLFSLLRARGTKRTYKKRSMLLYQGEVPQFAYVILKGTVKTYSLSANGEEQIIRLLSAGDIFTIPWIFKKTNRSLYYYQAHTDCVVVSIDRTVLLSEAQKNPVIQSALLEYFATLYTGSMVHITSLEQARAKEKILNILYYLCLTSGKEFKTGKYRVSLHLTHSIIASLSGLTRETTALELGKLKKVNIVKYTSRYYLIDKLGVESLLGEDSSTTLRLD